MYANSHWLFDEEMNPAEYVGFIYMIYDFVEKFYYIGKKRYKVSKGERRGLESDWRQYRSSNKELKKYAPSNLLYIVLDQYKTLGGLGYAESWSLFYVNAPFRPNFINQRIEAITYKVKEKPTKKHVERLKLWRPETIDQLIAQSQFDCE